MAGVSGRRVAACANARNRRFAVSRRVAGALAFAVCGWVLLAAATAHANSYTVHVCDSATGYRINAISYAASGSNAAFSTCPTDGGGHRIGVNLHAPAPQAPNVVYTGAGSYSYAQFDAPSGTDIRGLTMNAAGRGNDQGFDYAHLYATTDHFASFSNFWAMTSCGTSLGAGCLGQYTASWGPGTNALRWQLTCVSPWGCNTSSIGTWPYSPAYYFVNDAQITLEDYWDPNLSNGRGGLWLSSGWLSGVQHLGFDASDNTGIERAYVQVDGGDFGNSGGRSCNYTRVVPCGSSGADGDFDTHSIPDGAHTATIVAYDASGRSASSSHTFWVDNNSPGEPVGPSVVGGEDWHTVNDFTVQWSNPDQANGSAVGQAYYEICQSDGSNCTSGSQGGVRISQLQHLSVPGPGDYIVRVWLGDQAGVSDAKTPWLHLKFDNVPPDQAQPQHRNGWVNREDAKSYTQEIDPPQGLRAVPVSGIKGYAVTTDGSVPGNAVTDQADQTPGAGLWIAHHDLPGLPEGTTTVRARAISNAGIPSAQVGETNVHVDLTAPSADVAGAPDPSAWTRAPATFAIRAVETGGQSGMAGATGSDPTEAGGYVTYSVDGGDPQAVRGPDLGPPLAPDSLLPFASTADANVTVNSDGAHIVRYQAFDVAGNASGEKSVTFKIDQTPPNVVVFEDQQASDPRLIAVAANDQTSGLADGAVIQLREIKPSVGDWITLRTTREGNHYYAHVDNTTLPPGRYEFRATVPDQAGNVATGNTNRSGQPEQLDIDATHVGPYSTGTDAASGSIAGSGVTEGTTPTKLIAGIVVRGKIVTKKCPKRKHGKKRKCKPAPKSPLAGVRLVGSAKVPFGTRVPIAGQLTSNGHPLAGIEVAVLAKPNSVGAGFTGESSVRTDQNGVFTYSARTGPGRTLEFLYRGDATYHHSDHSVVIRVPAAATLKANRKSVRNGRSVTFSGLLRGGPIPPRGKLVDLQAFYRHRWRTFATARAGRNGRWHYRYRFGATHGRVTYRFRVRVRAEAAYPYELGYSKVTKVTVTG